MKLLDLAINTISESGVLMEAACVCLFIAKRQVRKLPFVFVFLAYSFCSDLILLAIEQRIDVWPALVITTYAGYLFEAAAVWELARKLLDLSHSAVAARRLLITALGCLFLTYAMTNMHSYGAFGSAERMFLRVDLIVSICRVLALILVLAMAGKYASGKGRLVGQMMIAFAVYAVCALLKHAFWELAPRWKLPATAFSIADCMCSLVWVMLLANLGWYLYRSQSRIVVSV